MTVFSFQNAFVFERYHVLARFYRRLNLHRKAGFYCFLMENSQFQALQLAEDRPAAAFTIPSSACLRVIREVNSRFLANPSLLQAYRLRLQPRSLRRPHCGGVVFVCDLVTTATTGSSGWSTLQQEVIMKTLGRIRSSFKIMDTSSLGEVSWETSVMLIG